LETNAFDVNFESSVLLILNLFGDRELVMFIRRPIYGGNTFLNLFSADTINWMQLSCGVYMVASTGRLVVTTCSVDRSHVTAVLGRSKRACVLCSVLKFARIIFWRIFSKRVIFENFLF
jgi:hypothetical protein